MARPREMTWTRRHDYRGCDVEYPCTVQFTASKGSRDYFDRSFGNWLPGDPAEVEIESVTVDDTGDDITAELTSIENDQITDAILDGLDDDGDDEDDARERAAEARADAREDR